MPGATSPLALPYPVAADAPAGHTQMQSLATAVQTALGSVAAGMQEGVIDAGAFEVTQASGGASMNLDVASNVGSGVYVDDDGLSPARQARYYVPPTAAKTTVTIGTANGSNPRVDRIVVSMAGVVSVVAGTATSGATLDNLTGAASVPVDSLLLADVHIPTSDTTIANTQIRDRRKWARGAFTSIERTTGTSVTTTSATIALIDATDMNPRIECSGNPIRMTLLGWSTGSARPLFAPMVDGAAIGSMISLVVAEGASKYFHGSYTFTPAAGSHRLGWGFRTETAPTAAGVLIGTGLPLTMVVEEIVRQNTANNATTTG